jgi:protocatechuate 3,4-dioxygenase beta subunit
MPTCEPRRTSGRRALLAALAGTLLVRPGFGQRAATPACGPDSPPTEAQTEGPYFKRSSPERASLLEPGLAGERLVLSGRVLTSDCRPVARALLDVWQADAGGAYDNRGFRLRGHLFTDADGRYRLETIVPGLYPGRTRHIHVKLQPPGGRVLTTQLYFPDEAANRRDGLFDPSLLVALERGAGTARAGFDFVLRA